MRVLRVRDSIPIQIDFDILNFPYQFEYNWTSVNNTFVNFNQSYIELQVSTKADPTAKTTTVSLYTNSTGAFTMTYEELICFCLEQLKQETNMYALIDSVDVEMVYGLPDGTQRALKYHEPSLHSSLGRKMIILKETSKNDLAKSCYGENLTYDATELSTLRYIRNNAGENVTLAIPFNLICGLGTDADTLINVKHLKMFFRMNPLKNLIQNNPCSMVYPTGKADAHTYSELTGKQWFSEFKLHSVDMNLMTYQGVQFNSNELYKTIPSYVQIDYQYQKVISNQFLVNRALPYLPEYILYWFTTGFDPEHISNIPERGIWPTYISCLVGNTQIFPQAEFPTQRYNNNVKQDGSILTYNNNKDIGCPNKLLYNLWADNSHPETLKNYDEWVKGPIFIIPCNALMDVRSNSGIELNMEMQIERNTLDFYFLEKAAKQDGGLATAVNRTKNSMKATPNGWKREPYAVADHHGYFYHYKNEVKSDDPVTLHMIAVRTIRDM